MTAAHSTLAVVSVVTTASGVTVTLTSWSVFTLGLGQGSSQSYLSAVPMLGQVAIVEIHISGGVETIVTVTQSGVNTHYITTISWPVLYCTVLYCTVHNQVLTLITSPHHLLASGLQVCPPRPVWVVGTCSLSSNIIISSLVSESLMAANDFMIQNPLHSTFKCYICRENKTISNNKHCACLHPS